MNTFDIFTLWKRSNDILGDDPELTEEKILEYLKPRIKKNTLQIFFNLFTYLPLQMASIIILSHNLAIFRENNTLLSVTASLLLISCLSFVYGLRLLIRIKVIGNNDVNLLKSIREKIRFYRTEFEIWLWICSASLLVLVFALNSMIDHVEGTFRIYNVGFYILISSVMFFGIYLLNKFSIFRIIKDLQGYLLDLENNVLDQTKKKEEWLKKNRWLIVLAIFCLVILSIFFAVKGILAFLSYG